MNKKTLIVVVIVVILIVSLSSFTSQPKMGTYIKNSRGVRNRNPLNIKKGGTTDWKGTTGYDDEGHAIFSSFVMGIRASLVDLHTKLNRGVDTIQEIVYAWALGNREQYIDYLTSKTGWTRSRVIKWEKEDLRKLVFYMGIFESTYSISAEEFEEAWKLANA